MDLSGIIRSGINQYDMHQIDGPDGEHNFGDTMASTLIVIARRWWLQAGRRAEIDELSDKASQLNRSPAKS